MYTSHQLLRADAVHYLSMRLRKNAGKSKAFFPQNSQVSDFKLDKNNSRKKIQIDQSNLQSNDVEILTQNQ